LLRPPDHYNQWRPDSPGDARAYLQGKQSLWKPISTGRIIGTEFSEALAERALRAGVKVLLGLHGSMKMDNAQVDALKAPRAGS
jgi:hypothetical protein